jgi:membrane protein implicated in regulation of membrane protease activity
MKQMLQIFAAMFMFAGILAGCITATLLLILMVRFPLLLIAVVLICWIFSRLRSSAKNTKHT